MSPLTLFSSSASIENDSLGKKTVHVVVSGIKPEHNKSKVIQGCLVAIEEIIKRDKTIGVIDVKTSDLEGRITIFATMNKNGLETFLRTTF